MANQSFLSKYNRACRHCGALPYCNTKCGCEAVCFDFKRRSVNANLQRNEKCRTFSSPPNPDFKTGRQYHTMYWYYCVSFKRHRKVFSSSRSVPRA
eukprot:2645121-Rhodomonas_salina.2